LGGPPSSIWVVARVKKKVNKHPRPKTSRYRFSMAKTPSIVLNLKRFTPIPPVPYKAPPTLPCRGVKPHKKALCGVFKVVCFSLGHGGKRWAPAGPPEKEMPRCPYWSTPGPPPRSQCPKVNLGGPNEFLVCGVGGGEFFLPPGQFPPPPPGGENQKNPF